MVARVSGIAKAGRVLVWEVTLECGVFSAENAARVAGDKLGLPGRTSLACRFVGVGLKASRTHAGSGGCGQSCHATRAGGACSITRNCFKSSYRACFTLIEICNKSSIFIDGIGNSKVTWLAFAVQDRRGALGRGVGASGTLCRSRRCRCWRGRFPGL